MKRIGITLIPIVFMVFPMFSQNVNIPDTIFLAALIEEGVDTNGDGQISYEEAEPWKITSVYNGRASTSTLREI